MIKEEHIQRLLASHEGVSLDFKSAQYPHCTGNAEELVKDILAFANASRKEDAFILIGVQEIKGSCATVLGITDHLDDAYVQQLINSKTQRTIDLSVATVPVAGKRIDVIRIRKQSRPIYLKAAYGRLKPNTVYVRQGSSTKEATPDEIARMAAEDMLELPSFEVNFAICKFGMPCTYEAVDASQHLSLKPLDIACADFLASDDPTANDGEIVRRHEAANRFREMSRLFCFSLTNTSKVSTRAVRGTIACPKGSGLFVLPGGRIQPYFALFTPDAKAGFQEAPASWIIYFTIGKILPGETST